MKAENMIMLQLADGLVRNFMCEISSRASHHAARQR